MKGVKNYLKNVTKSTIYYAQDIAKDDLMPNVGDFAETNAEFLKSAYQTVRNPKTAFKKVIDDVANSKMYEAIDYGAKNLFEDLKTGNFYNKERKDKDTGKFAGLNADDFNDLSEFGIDDDWENNLGKDDDEDVTAGDLKIVEAVEGSNKALASSTANAVISSANATIKNQRVATGILYQQNERLFGGLHQDVSILNATMDTMLKLQTATFQNIDKNMSDFFSQSLKLQTENNAILKQMLDIQMNMYKSAQQKEDEARKDKTRGKRYSDITSGGVPDLQSYFENIQANVMKKIKESTSLPDFSGDGEGNMMKELMVNPMEFIIKPVVSSLIPNIVKQSTQELDKTIAGLFGQAMGALTNAKNDNPDGIFGKLADFLGVRTSINKNIDVGKYHKGPVPFDGVTRKAIIEVIPAYLRRIEAALSGRPETMYDYDSGKWISPKDIKREFDDIRKNAVRQGTSDLRSGMQKYIKQERTSLGIKGENEQKDFDKAVDEFFQFLYDRNGRFNPAKSADDNKIDSKYTYLRKYYNQIRIIYTNFDMDTSGTKARHTNLSSRIGLANSIMAAKDAEERRYRSLEEGTNKITQYFANGGKFDQHGKWRGDNKDKWEANSMGLLAAVDDKGNNVFNYLQNISKELEWQRTFMSNNGFGGGRGKNKNITVPDFNKIDIKRFNAKDSDKSSLNKDEKALKDAIKLIAEGKTINWATYEGDTEADAKLLDELAYRIQQQSTEDQKKIKNAARDENFITRIVNKKYETNKDAKKLEEDIEDIVKETVKEKADEEYEKEDSIFSRVMNQANKAKNFFSGLAQAPGEIFADVLYSADRAIYDMLFKNALKEDGEEPEEYEGFMDMLQKKTSKLFNNLGESLQDKFINPLKEKLGIGDDFGDKTKDAIKKLGTNIMGKVVEANKEVYTPAVEYLNQQFGISEKLKPAEAALFNQRYNNRQKTFAGAKEVTDMTLADLITRGQELGMDVSDKAFKNSKFARKAVRSEYYKKALKDTKNGTEFGDEDQITQFFKLVVSMELDQTEIQELAKNNNLSIRGDSLNEIIYNLYQDVTDKYRTDRSNLLDKIENARNSKKLTGDIENKAWTSLHDLDKLRAAAYENNIDQNAKGTIASIPFKGTTMLSKGEMLFNSKGVGVVNKTDAYNLTEPTHILSSYDSNPLLKSMGMNPGARRTPEQDLRSENALKDKLFGKGAGIANHAEGSTVKVNGNGSGIDYDLIKENLKQYAPEGIAGGIVGGIVSTLFGVVGGPLVGAAVGAAGNIVANSDSLKDKLFGPLGEDNKRHGGGLIGKNIMDALNKYAPDALKYGMAGIIPGLLTPLGPLGGILVGSAIGVLKNNEAFTDKYFGEEGKLSFSDDTKKIIQDLLPGAAKGAAVGTIASFLFGGPFGLLGNAALGAGIGMIGSTEEFKDMILGTEVNGVRAGGLLGELKKLATPLQDAGEKIANKLVRAIDEGIVDPISRFLTPAIHELPHILSIFPKFISNTITDKLFSEDSFFGKQIRKVLTPVIKTAGNIVGGGLDLFRKFNPLQLFGIAGDAITNRQIRGLRATRMLAKDRVKHMRDQEKTASKFDIELAAVGSGAKGAMTVDQLKEMRNNMLAVRDNSRDLDRNFKKKQNELSRYISRFSNANGGTFTADTEVALTNALKDGDMDAFMLQLDNAILTDGSRLTRDEKDALLNGSSDGGKTSLFKSFKELKDLEARRKNVGKFGGKNKTDYLDDIKKAVGAKFGDDAASQIKSYSDLDKFIKNFDREITNREAGGRAEILSPELKEEKKQTDLLTQINDSLKKAVDGMNTEDKNATDKAQNDIDKAVDKSDKRQDRKEEARAEDMPKYLAKKGIDFYNDLPEDVQTKLLNRTDEELYKKVVGLGPRAKEYFSSLGHDTIPTKIGSKIKGIKRFGSNSLEWFKETFSDMPSEFMIGMARSWDDIKSGLKRTKNKANNTIDKLNTKSPDKIKAALNIKDEENTEESIPNAQPAVANNGLGTFLLNGAKAVGGLAAKGISKLFGNKEEGNGIGAKAAGMLGSLFASKAGASDDNDGTSMNGNNVVREDGRSMKMKKDSNGSMVPDTSDSNTKQTLNLISIKEKAQEKLHEAQLKASETIEKIFNPPEGKKKKIGWLGIALGGAALVKSGLLKKLFDNVIKPIWDEKLKPWIEEKAIPWLKDEALPKITTAIGEIAGSIISGLPNALWTALKTTFPLFETMLNKIAGGGNNDPTVTTQDQLEDGTVFYDANGNAVDKDNLQAGIEYTNLNGGTVIMDENGNIIATPKKDHTYLKKTGKGMVRAAFNSAIGMRWANAGVGLANKGLTKLTNSKNLIVKGVGYTGKAFTAPITMADKAGQAVYNGRDSLRNLVNDTESNVFDYAKDKAQESIKNRITDKLDNKTYNILDKAYKAEDTAMKVGNAVEKVDNVLFKGKNKEKIANATTNVADNIHKLGNKAVDANTKIAGLITRLTEGLDNLFSNSTVIKKLDNIASKLGIKGAAKWVGNLKNKILTTLSKFIKGAGKQVEKITTKLGAKGIALIALATDFVFGCDQAESILGVQETSLVEEFVAGLTNALCNFTIILSIFPGTGRVAEAILKLFGQDINERQAAAEAEYQEYKKKTGDTISKEEYLKRNKSITGKIGGKIKDGFNKVKEAAKGGIKGIKDKAGNVISKTGKSIKNAFSRDENGNLNILESIKNSEFVTKVTDLISKAKETLGSIGSALTAPSNLLYEGKFREYFTFSSEEDKDNPFGIIKTIATATSRILGFPINMTGAIGKNIWDVIKACTGGLGNIIKTGFNTFKESTNLIAQGRFGEYFTFKTAGMDEKNPLSKFGGIITAVNRIVGLPINLITGGVKCIADNFDTILDEGKGLVSTIWGELTGNGANLLANGDLLEYFTMPDVGKGYGLSGLHKIIVGTSRIMMFPANALGSAVKSIANNWDNIVDGCKSLFGNGLIQSITTDAMNTMADGDIGSYFDISDPDGDETNQFSGIRKVMIGVGRVLAFPYNAIGSLGKNIFGGIKDAFGSIKESASAYATANKKIWEYLADGKSTEDMDNDQSLVINTGSFMDNLFNSLLFIPATIVRIVSPIINMGKKIKDAIGDVLDKAGEGWNSFWSKLRGDDDEETESGTGKYGRSKFGRAKQIDPRIANIRFNAPGDKSYQTIGDSGCGPAAAVTAMQSVYGRSTDPTVQAANFAIKNGYKEKDGGTKPGFFTDYFNQNGLGSSTYTNRSDMEASIRSGNPTVLMGQDKGGVNSSNPYGKNPHYITATGVDGRGNVIIQDPESKYNDQLYNINDVLNKSSIGISAYGKGKNYVSASRFGRGKDIASQVWGYLKSKQFSDESAAGIMGNLKAESGMDPTSIQNGGKGPAAGICQWESYTAKNGRWKNLYNYAKSHNREWTDLAIQLDFMMTELDSCLKTYSGKGFPKHPYSNYPSTEVGWGKKMDLEKYKLLTNVVDAVKIFSQCFERAGIPHMQNRIKYAKEYLKQFAGKEGTAIESADSTGENDSENSSASESFIGILGDIINNSTAAKALGLLTGANSSSSSSSSSSDDSDDSSYTAGGDAKSVVDIALKEVGTKEKPMGSNSIKYNDWYYGKKVSGSSYPWCSAFVSWVADKAGIPKDVIPKTASVNALYNAVKKSGKEVTDISKAQPGDIAIFGSDKSTHTGLVQDFSNNQLHTVEGNSSDQVIKRTYAKGQRAVTLVRPNYSTNSATDSTKSKSNGGYAEVSEFGDYSALGGNQNKPISKHGTYKGNRAEYTRLNSSNKTKSYSNADYNNQASQYGMASRRKSNNTDKLIETVIDILMTIADNTDKLNTIVSILNEKLGIDVSKELNNKDLTKDTKKKRLRKSLMNRTQANSDIDGQSINFILDSMNALASE